jgi:hypothetical protein
MKFPEAFPAVALLSVVLSFMAACSDSDDTFAPVTDDRIYVMGGAMPGGSGTEQTPYGSLAEVEANSLAGDSIVVLYSDTMLDGGVALKTGQQLSGRITADRLMPSIANTSATLHEGAREGQAMPTRYLLSAVILERLL